MKKLQDAYAAIQKAASLFRNSSGAHGTAPIQLPEDISKQTNLIFNDLGLEYMIDGHYAKAIVLFNKVIENESLLCQQLHSVDYKYYVNRGDCYRALEAYDEVYICVCDYVCMCLCDYICICIHIHSFLTMFN